MAYNKQNWADGPGGGTPISAARLKHIEDGIDGAAVLADMADASSATGAALRAALGLTPGYDIVILAGQSNMSGRGTPYSASTDPVNPLVFQYKSKAPNANTIVPAAEPLDMHDTPSGIGPGLQFARWYASRKLQPARQVLLVPVAHGGTPLSSTAALGWRRGVAGNLYANMVTQAQGALAAAGTGSRIVALLWAQGETDGDNATTAAQYQTDLDALLNGIRTDLGVSDLPIVLGTMVPEYLNLGTRKQIDAVQRSTPNRIARVDVAVGAGNANRGDGNHYSAAGQRLNGRTMYDAYERITQGVAPYSEGLPADLGPVAGLTATTVGGISTALTWTTLGGATSYLVQAKGPADTTWQEIGAPTSASGTFGPLLPSTTYQIRVVPVGAAGAGYPCDPITVRTTAGTSTVTDAFTRTSAASLGTADTGQVYATLVGTCATDGSAAYHGSGVNHIGVLDAGAADAFAEIALATLAAAGTDRLIARNDNTVNNYWLLQYRQTTNTYQVYKCSGGAFTQVGVDLSVAPANGDRIGIAAVGQYLMFTVNRTVQARIADAFVQTNTRYGLGGGGSNTGRFDNFSVLT